VNCENEVRGKKREKNKKLNNRYNHPYFEFISSPNREIVPNIQLVLVGGKTNYKEISHDM